MVSTSHFPTLSAAPTLVHSAEGSSKKLKKANNSRIHISGPLGRCVELLLERDAALYLHNNMIVKSGPTEHDLQDAIRQIDLSTDVADSTAVLQSFDFADTTNCSIENESDEAIPDSKVV